MAEETGGDVTTALVQVEEDEEARLFLQKQFGAISPEMWQWFFRGNPHGEPLIVSGRIAGELVGINAVVKRRIAIRGVEFEAGQDSYLVTHAGYRRRGIMRRVVLRNWEEADRRGLALLFIFQAADNASLPGFIRCGGVSLGRIGQRIRVLDATYLLERRLKSHALARLLAAPINLALRTPDPPPSLHGHSLSEITEVDERFTALWREVAPLLPVACVRDAAWLHYRYLTHPERSYRIIGLTSGIRLRGYAVLEDRPAGPHDPARTFLVDFLAAADQAVHRAMTGSVIAHARKAGSSAIHGWIPAVAPWFRTFRRAGFIEQKGVHGVLVQRLPPQGAITKPLSLADWCLTMGDSDLY